MAIDLKNIIGQGKSTILSPAEIADLGMKRRQMQQQEERFQFTKDQSVIDNIFNNADSFTTQEQLKGALDNLNTIESNDATINSFKSITMSKLQDNQSNINKVKELEDQFKTFNNIDRKLYEKPDVNADDLFNIINGYNKLALELGSPEYANYLSPELQAEFALKSDHYGMIGDALITGNAISEEEWKAISSGNRERFREAKKVALDSIDVQYKTSESRYNSLNNVLIQFMQSKAKDDDLDNFILQADAHGANMSNINSADEFGLRLKEQIERYENDLKAISQRNEAWRGEKLFLESESTKKDGLFDDVSDNFQNKSQFNQQVENKSQFNQQDQDFVTPRSEDGDIKTSTPRTNQAKSTRFENQPDPGESGAPSTRDFGQDPSVVDFSNIQGQLSEASNLQNKLKKGKFGKDSIKKANALKTVRQIDGITKELKSVERSKKEYERLTSQLNELSKQQSPLLTEKERKKLAKKKRTIQRRINELGDRQRKIVKFGGTGGIELQSSVGGLSTFNTRGFSDLDGNFEVLNMEALPKYFAEIEAKFAEKLNEYSKSANDLLK